MNLGAPTQGLEPQVGHTSLQTTAHAVRVKSI